MKCIGSYSQDDFVPLIDQGLGVVSVGRIRGHLLDDAQNFVVQNTKGVMRIG